MIRVEWRMRHGQARIAHAFEYDAEKSVCGRVERKNRRTRLSATAKRCRACTTVVKLTTRLAKLTA